MRDPRIEPMPGDVLCKNGRRREVVFVGYDAVQRCNSIQCVETSKGTWYRIVRPTVNQFRKWAKTAELNQGGGSGDAGFVEDNSETEANARLIDAAPELYYCLQQLIEGIPTTKRDWLDPDLERRAKSVLAKVYGQ